MTVTTVLEATGTSYRQICIWRDRGWLHTPSLGEGAAYPWMVEIRQIDWLARLNQSRDLDDEDAIGGYVLRVGEAKWGLRVGRGRWRAHQPGDLQHAIEAGEPFTLAVVVRPEIQALVNGKAA